MPEGFCAPPLCWDLIYNFAKMKLFVLKPEDVPNWGKGINIPLNQFPNEVAAFQAKLNAQAQTLCVGANCVCVRLHKKALTFALGPQRIGAHPAGVTDIFLDGITATGFFGLCSPRRWVKLKKGDKWVPVEDLKVPDVILPSSPPKPGSSGGGSKKSKKGAKGKKGRKGTKKRARRSAY